MDTDTKDKKLLTMDEMIGKLCAAVNKIKAVLAMLPVLHSSLQTMQNDMLKINSNTQNLTNKMEVMAAIRPPIPAVGSPTVIGSEAAATTAVIAADPILAAPPMVQYPSA
jgi:hypothetical protein